MLLAEVAALAKVEGVTLQGRLDAINERFGRHVMADMSVKMHPADGSRGRRPAARRPRPPRSGIAPCRRWSGSTKPACFGCSSARSYACRLRPSGTEPKVKLYGEGIDIDPAPYLDSLAALSSRYEDAGEPNCRSPASPRPGTMNACSLRCSSTAAV